MLETSQTRAMKPGRCNPVQAQTYEITFLGQAGTTLRTEFEDCEVTIGPGTTTLRAELPDRDQQPGTRRDRREPGGATAWKLDRNMSPVGG
jgi:hypothetical protein